MRFFFSVSRRALVPLSDCALEFALRAPFFFFSPGVSFLLDQRRPTGPLTDLDAISRDSNVESVTFSFSFFGNSRRSPFPEPDFLSRRRGGGAAVLCRAPFFIFPSALDNALSS